MIANTYEKHKSTVISLLMKDPYRMDVLNCVREVAPNNTFVAAGFIRNLIWDYLHHKVNATPLNDIDVIYLDKAMDAIDKATIEDKLKQLRPQIKWQVKNQAVMHSKNGDRSYHNLLDAMSFWPEKETAVAIRLRHDGSMECLSSFGLTSLFRGYITYNPKRQKSVFLQRLKEKKWLQEWPSLIVNDK